MKVTSTLKLPTYNCKVVLMVTDQLSKQVNSIYRKHKIPCDFNMEAEGVMVSIDMNTYYLILDDQYVSHNTIAHEAYHVVNRILKDREIHDEESGAWIAGHVSEFIYKSLNKKKLTVKYG